MPVTDKQITHLKDLKKNNEKEFKRKLEEVDNELFNEYCSKKSYKDKCEAAYCVDAHTNTCQYLKEMRKLWNVFGKES